MRALITGGSGFIGTNLIAALEGQADLLNLDPSPPRDSRQLPYWRAGSVLDGDLLRRSVREFQPDVVFHLGARTDLGGDSTEDYQANTVGVRNVSDAVIRDAPGCHTIFASSRLVFAIDHRPKSTFDYRPSTSYGESKILGEKIVRAQDEGSWTIVRPTSIWGPWFDVPYRDFFDMVSKQRYVKFRQHDPQKSFGYVGNAVHQLIQIAKADREITHGEVLWLSDYTPLRLSEWADMVSDALGQPRPRYAPFWLAKMAARAGDLAQRAGVSRVPLTTFRLNNLITPMVYDTSRTEEIVGPLPYTLKAGVEATVKWFRDQSKS